MLPPFCHLKGFEGWGFWLCSLCVGWPEMYWVGGAPLGMFTLPALRAVLRWCSVFEMRAEYCGLSGARCISSKPSVWRTANNLLDYSRP